MAVRFGGSVTKLTTKYRGNASQRKSMKIIINRQNWVERGSASTPLFLIPGFSLHFPLELSYGYLRFEGNGKISLGRQGKRSLKGRAYSKK